MLFHFDFDSSRVQLDILGHSPTPSVSVKSFHLCFFPDKPHLFADRCWLCSSTSFLCCVHSFFFKFFVLAFVNVNILAGTHLSQRRHDVSDGDGERHVVSQSGCRRRTGGQAEIARERPCLLVCGPGCSAMMATRVSIGLIRTRHQSDASLASRRHGTLTPGRQVSHYRIAH